MFGPIRSALDKIQCLDLVLLVFLCFALGFIGGTPYFHPDTLLDNALHTIETGGMPEYYNKPGLMVYLHAAIYYLTYVLLNAINAVGSFGDFSALQQQGYLMGLPLAIPLDLPGHLLTLCFSIVGVLVVYLWTLSLTGKRIYALLAGALIGTSLLWVTNSHYLAVDIALGALCITIMFMTARFTKAGGKLTPGNIAVLGILLGLTASAKYNGAIIYIPIAVAMLPCYRKNLRGWVLALIAMAVIAVLVFLLTNPGLLLDTRNYLDTLFFEYNHSSTSHWGYDTDGFAGDYFLFTALPAGFGLLPLLLSFAGACGVIRSKAGNPEKIALLLFPVFYLVFMGAYKLTFDRFMVPMIPFLAILAAMGVYHIGSSLGAGKTGLTWQKALVAVLIVACILPGLAASVSHVVVLDGTDTREDLELALKDSGLDSPDLKVSLGTYAIKPVQQSLSQVIILKKPYEELETMLIIPTDIVVIDSFSFDRVFYDPINVYPLASLPTDNFTVVKISPFMVPKDDVPFSPASLYSPYLPDLAYRDRPGPFIEIYCKDSGIAGKIIEACTSDGISCEVRPGNEGYYYRMLFVNAPPA